MTFCGSSQCCGFPYSPQNLHPGWLEQSLTPTPHNIGHFGGRLHSGRLNKYCWCMCTRRTRSFRLPLWNMCGYSFNGQSSSNPCFPLTAIQIRMNLKTHSHTHSLCEFRQTLHNYTRSCLFVTPTKQQGNCRQQLHPECCPLVSQSDHIP